MDIDGGNLVGFQQALNDQFVKIFEDRQAGSFGTEASENLGLIEHAAGINFFFPLKSLRSISNDNKFESVYLTKPWLIGFNQIHGDVYTIVDLKRIMEFVLNAFNDSANVSPEVNVLYFRNGGETKFGVIINALHLQDSQKLEMLFKQEEGEGWNQIESQRVDSLILGSVLSDAEKNVLKVLKGGDLSGSSSSVALLNAMVGDVFWDSAANSLICSVDVKKMSEFLMKLSPF